MIWFHSAKRYFSMCAGKTWNQHDRVPSTEPITRNVGTLFCSNLYFNRARRHIFWKITNHIIGHCSIFVMTKSELAKVLKNIIVMCLYCVL